MSVRARSPLARSLCRLQIAVFRLNAKELAVAYVEQRMKYQSSRVVREKEAGGRGPSYRWQLELVRIAGRCDYLAQNSITNRGAAIRLWRSFWPSCVRRRRSAQALHH
jgi:hypothetical protein